MANLPVSLFTFALLVGVTLGQNASHITVHYDTPGHQVSPLLWGIFFEEINHAGEGGLYGELIYNRALSPKRPSLQGWSTITSGQANGRIYISRDNPLNDQIPISLRLDIVGSVAPGARIGVANDGFWGIPIRPDYTYYRASFYAKATPGILGPITVSIESKDGSIVYAYDTIRQLTTDFERYEVFLVPPLNMIRNVSLDNVFIISTGMVNSDAESIFLSVVSLFPPTYNYRTNGMRIDLMEKLVAAKPKFFRFPGGNFLEGNFIEERFIWEETIGDIAQRPGHVGCWNYYSSDGLGLLEYLEIAEDLDAEIVLGVYAGYSLYGESVPPEEMGPFIESALNEIEYVIGGIDTTWGAVRASNGHPQPFNLTYVEIGNEDWFSSDYEIRYPLFYDAITAKYPQLTVIATQDVKSRPVPVLDDHYYPTFGWFPDNHDLYDDAPRNGSQIFVGEYACRGDGSGRVPADTAASMDDAAFMTGLERNSDIVIMACYAPLFSNINDFTWTPDAIYYDGLNSFANVAWWVQHMFSVFQGDVFIPTDADTDVVRPRKVFHSASLDTKTNTLILKLVNTDFNDHMLESITLQGVTTTKGGRMNVLTGGRYDFNDIANPLKIAPSQEVFNVTSNTFGFNAPAFSLTILEIQL